jgi:hypothetical protein
VAIGNVLLGVGRALLGMFLALSEILSEQFDGILAALQPTQAWRRCRPGSADGVHALQGIGGKRADFSHPFFQGKRNNRIFPHFFVARSLRFR